MLGAAGAVSNGDCMLVSRIEAGRSQSKLQDIAVTSMAKAQK
jgi:hypothetical protein